METTPQQATHSPSTQQVTSTLRTTGNPTDDIVAYAKQYARQSPEKAALWCLGAGFVLGWKLKPW